MNLYPGDPPNYLMGAPAERVDASNGIIYNVSVPTLRRYPVDATKSTGVAWVVFPGGGYALLDMETHATALAKRMGPAGVAVFALKYRISGGSSNPRVDALLDANRALRLVRSNAAKWGLDPRRIGIISYSAGSHLALTLAGTFDAGQTGAADPVERASSRPDFMGVMCAWADGSPSSPFTFDRTSPPTYLCHAEDDTTAPIALAQAVEQELTDAGVLSHLEVYPTGGHSAFHVGDPKAPGRDWPDKFVPWLQANKLVP
jgi:endo-1,4-beta-xylanase